jgi:hypothetical protein
MRNFTIVVMFSFLVSGCCAEQAITEQQKAQQDCLMKEFLNGSSPRNMNREPKALPEFNHFFKTSPKPCDNSNCPETE